MYIQKAAYNIKDRMAYSNTPVITAMSWSMAFLLSPNPGALTAQTFIPPLSLLTISVDKASDSTSSAMINSGL
jgi:nitrate reductase beta subunit